MPEMFIKGITLKSRLDYLENIYGKESLKRLLPYLSERAKSLFSDPRRIRATSWYEFGLQVEFDKAICQHLAGGNEEVYRSMGAFSAEFQREHSTPSDFNDPWKFLQLQAVVFGRYFKPGKMELVRASMTEGYMKLLDFRSAKENCLTNIGFLRRHFELFGFKNILVEEVQCSTDPSVPYCEFHFKWEK